MKLPNKDFFHLFMEIRTVEGKYILEKNAAVSVALFEVPPENCEKESVRFKLGDISMNRIPNVTRKFMGDEQFFGYNIPLNNCQNFIHNILKS
jgi:hypothetical protein